MDGEQGDTDGSSLSSAGLCEASRISSTSSSPSTSEDSQLLPLLSPPQSNAGHTNARSPSRNTPLICVLPHRSGSIVSLRARVGVEAAVRRLFRPSLPPWLFGGDILILGFEDVERGTDRPGRTHTHGPDESAQWGDAPLWTLLDV